MTFISPAPGRRPARRPRWLVAATATAALALGVPAPAAVAAVDDPAVADPVTASVAPAGDGVVPASGPLTLTLSADNPGDDALPAGEATFELGVERLTTTAALDAWLGDGAASGAFDDLERVDVAEVPAQQSVSQTVSIAATDAVVDDLAAGVYPVRAIYRAGDESIRARTVVVVPAAGTAEREVGVVVPITAGPQTTGALGADALTELTGDEGALRQQLDAVSGTEAILAVDPSVTASIRALGSAAPAEAVAWLDELLALPNDRFALQYGDADLAAQIGAGATAPVRPASFAAYLDAANFTEVGTAGADATPAPTPTPDEPVLPSLEELFDVGAARDAVFWPATGTAGAEAAAVLGAQVGSEDAPVTLLPSSVVRTSVERTDAAAHATAGDADLLVYESELSRVLEDASTTDGVVERGALLAEFTARTALTAPTGPLLVTVDRADGRSTAALSDAVRAATGLPGWRATDLDGLLGTGATSVELASVAPDPDRIAVIEEFQQAQDGLLRIATVLDDPALLTSSERATELQLLGNAWRDDREGWDAAIEAQRERIATWTDGVALVPGGPITLAGSSAPLVFTVRNDLPWPARVELLATPGDARLVIQSVDEVEIGAQQTARVAVPVSALVGSGETSVDLQLRSPTGVEIGPTETVEVSVRAEWESVAVIILSVLVTGLLVLGVVRTVRRRRMPVAA